MFNMNNLMAQAKQMKATLDKKTKEFNEKQFTCEYQGVEVTMTGDHKIASIKINEKDLLDDKDDLQDILIVAVNRTLEKVKEEHKAFMGPLAQAPTGLF